MHIYLHREHFAPDQDPRGEFHYKYHPNISLFGEAVLTRPVLQAARTVFNECWIGLASSRGTIWTVDPNDPDNKQLNRYEGSAYTGTKKVCHFANAAANASVPSFNHEQISQEMSNEISSANADSAVYFNGRIQTFDYDPSTLYVAELNNGVTCTVGTADLIDAYRETGRVSSVVQLNPLDGVAYASAPAKPRPRRLATTTWASIKQQ